MNFLLGEHHRERGAWGRWLLLALLMAAFATPAWADSITLRQAVRLAPEATIVTLGDIAQLEGSTAIGLADVQVGTLDKDSGTWVTIDVAHVREALKGHKELNWSTLTIHGTSAQVRRMAPPKEPEPEPEAADAPDPNQGGPNLRMAIAQRLTDMLAVQPEQLRLKFDDRDAKTLTTSTAGRVVDIQPLGSGDRVPLAVRIYEGDKVFLNTTLRVQAEVQRHVAVATGLMKRGQVLGDGDVTLEDRWLPATARPLPPDQVVGKAIRQSVNPGDVIDMEDVQPPVVVRRGELVSVHCVTDGFVLKLTCRALSDGRDGELMQFETLEAGKKERRTIYARPAGPGTAIATPTGNETNRPLVASEAPADSDVLGAELPKSDLAKGDPQLRTPRTTLPGHRRPTMSISKR